MLVYTIMDIFLLPLLAVGLFFGGRWVIRKLRIACREVRDCIWVMRAGIPSPIQIRHDFIQDMGREPTIEEVHDLHEMLKSQHDQARNGLIAVAVGIVGSFMLFHRELNK